MPELSPTAMEDIDESEAARLYAEIGARPVINAAGAYTILGGSTLSPAVRKAMAAANRYYADMKGLLASSGEIIAGMLGVEAALVTSGAAAALALAAAACLTRTRPELLERLPDTTGIPNEILVQRNLRAKYDRCITISGARLVEYGDGAVTTVDQLRNAIGPNTVALHYLAPGEQPGILSLEAMIEAAHGHGLPVIVDAAGQTYPLHNLRKYARMGADLVCYAGKYFDAPHSTGVLMGRKDLVELAAVNSFIGFETSGFLTIGRPMKVDRQEIFAAVVALREWLAMDHEERLMRYGERAEVILRELRGLDGIKAFRISERETPLPVVRDGVRIVMDSAAAAEAVVIRLRDGEPCIWARSEDGALNVSVAFCADDEIEIIARRLREALTQ